jgi:hypothetical protein
MWRAKRAKNKIRSPELATISNDPDRENSKEASFAFGVLDFAD